MEFILFSLRKSKITRLFCHTLRELKLPKLKSQSRKVIFYLNSAVYIKKNKTNTKFKIRKGKHLFTYSEKKPDIAKKITDSLD